MWERLLIFVAIALLAGCGGEPDETPQQKEQRDKAADANQSPATCAWDAMEAQRLNGLAWEDESQVCDTMQSLMGRPPSIALMRLLSKAIFIFQVSGDKDPPKELAYQMMNIAEIRGQTNDEPAMRQTFETVVKIFKSTDGHVTPKDMNIVLRRPEVTPRQLDDQGIFLLGQLVWEMKKAKGE